MIQAIIKHKVIYQNPSQMMQKKAITLGNGPSLRGFDFHSLNDIDTLGMNAAYRYWDKIGWYPTYYCCLDTELIVTHHSHIKRLITDGLVKKAFVEGSFFEFYPECLPDDRFYSFDQFRLTLFKQRGETTGRIYYENPAFLTSQPSKVTTGAYAIRFLAFLGYEQIGILGVDLKYTEIIPEANLQDGIKLKIKKTPTNNPNYFFDDYQREGDMYNIPNPDIHNGRLHIDAFRVLRNDFKKHRQNIKLTNCNQKSALFEFNILPFQTLQQFKLGHPPNPKEYNSSASLEIKHLAAEIQLWATCFSYARFAEFIQSKNTKLFRIGQLVMKIARSTKHSCQNTMLLFRKNKEPNKK